MAKPIEPELVLEDEDAREFHRFMENPKKTTHLKGEIWFAEMQIWQSGPEYK